MRLARFALSSAAAKKARRRFVNRNTFVCTESKPLNQWLRPPIASLRTQQAAASRTVEAAFSVARITRVAQTWQRHVDPGSREDT